MRGRFLGGSVALGAALTLALGCLVVFPSCTYPRSLGRGFDDLDASEVPPSFTSFDAGPDVDVRQLTSYCPSNKCPEGFTTCPGSTFPCDVDLKTDINNCGACGVSCGGPTTAELFECVEGHCALRCKLLDRMDCDGIVDNGCETPPNDQNNCGVCGNACAPDKPCVNVGTTYQCGCDNGGIACYGRCYDPMNDDFNCGSCGTFCPRSDGTPLKTNTYLGCVGGQCGNVKCNKDTADCDQDSETGCETSLADRNNCGACGNVCPAGRDCRRNLLGLYECLCPGGKTYCNGKCVDVASDPENCGSCGNTCHITSQLQSVGICNFGTCNRKCVTGRADCNGNPADDCETDTNSDPRNCGGCGIVCDAIAGQACVRGRCTVEPCEQPDGGPVPQ